MTAAFLLIMFLIQFLVALGVLMFVIFLAHPQVPLSGGGLEEKPAPARTEDRLPTRIKDDLPTFGKAASESI